MWKYTLDGDRVRDDWEHTMDGDYRPKGTSHTIDGDLILPSGEITTQAKLDEIRQEKNVVDIY